MSLLSAVSSASAFRLLSESESSTSCHGPFQQRSAAKQKTEKAHQDGAVFRVGKRLRLLLDRRAFGSAELSISREAELVAVSCSSCTSPLCLFSILLKISDIKGPEAQRADPNRLYMALCWLGPVLQAILDQQSPQTAHPRGRRRHPGAGPAGRPGTCWRPRSASLGTLEHLGTRAPAQASPSDPDRSRTPIREAMPGRRLGKGRVPSQLFPLYLPEQTQRCRKRVPRLRWPWLGAANAAAPGASLARASGVSESRRLPERVTRPLLVRLPSRASPGTGTPGPRKHVHLLHTSAAVASLHIACRNAGAEDTRSAAEPHSDTDCEAYAAMQHYCTLSLHAPQGALFHPPCPRNAGRAQGGAGTPAGKFSAAFSGRKST